MYVRLLSQQRAADAHREQPNDVYDDYICSYVQALTMFPSFIICCSIIIFGKIYVHVNLFNVSHCVDVCN